MFLTTLCYIEHEDRYLMLHRIKKQKDVNKDKWIGVGGKFQPNEAPEECMLREVFEETGLTLTSWRLRGILTFLAQGWEMEYIFLYTADGYTGKLKECEEGALEWVKKTEIPSLNLWEGDRIFFELLEKREDVFSLKLQYQGDTLVYAALDGEKIR